MQQVIFININISYAYDFAIIIDFLYIYNCIYIYGCVIRYTSNQMLVFFSNVIQHIADMLNKYFVLMI